MTLAPPEFQTLTEVSPEWDDRRDAGTITLKWSTSRKVARQVEVIAGEFQEITDVEPATITETLTYSDFEKFREAADRYHDQLGKPPVTGIVSVIQP